MASEAVIEFTDDNFDSEVLGASEPVMVDFWAEWCGPCKALGPVVDEVADELSGKARVGKLDTDANQQIAAKFSIMSIPTMLFFKDGELKDRMSGYSGNAKAEMIEKLNALMD
ncbi:MAG: thioredoxin [Phycisphaerales bacterium]